MQYETKTRSILKAISWRILATLTTMGLVFVFTGRFMVAISIGVFEVVGKMIFYFGHERLWERIRYGREEIQPFVLWFTGLPASRKKEVAERVFSYLGKAHLKVERLDSRDVRPLFPETGFSPKEVNRHVKRAGHLCSMLEKNGIIVVASFVSPYKSSREFVRSVSQNFIEVYMKSTPNACEKRDTKGRYQKAKQGKYRYFPGIDVTYEDSPGPEIVIDVDNTSPDQAARQIVDYLKKHVIGAKQFNNHWVDYPRFQPDSGNKEEGSSIRI